MKQKRTKWNIASTIDAGNQTVELISKYKAEIEERLTPDETQEFIDSISVLNSKRHGQTEILAVQKSRTGTQDELAMQLHEVVMQIRQLVKVATDDEGIRKAFGVGENTNARNINMVKAEANIVIEGYNHFTDWARAKAGIIESDMEEVSSLLNILTSADDVQEVSKIIRKLSTMDKDILQRKVEDTISKISALGVRIFSGEHPTTARLFADLIPG